MAILLKGHQNPKYLCTKETTSQYLKKKTDRPTRRKKQIYNYSQLFQHSALYNL